MVEVGSSGGWVPVATEEIAGRAVGVYRKPGDGLALSDGAGNAEPCTLFGHSELGIGETVTVIGGYTPAGATSVQIAETAGTHRYETIGGDTWCAVLQQPSFGERLPVPILYRAADGQTIAAPRPPGTQATLVKDCIETCPACGGHTWERLEDDDSGQYDEHSPLAGAAVWVACSACGHLERGGLIRLPAGGRQAAENRATGIPVSMLKGVTDPIYRVAHSASRVRTVIRSRRATRRVEVECVISEGQARVEVHTRARTRSRNPLFASNSWELVDAMTRAQLSSADDHPNALVDAVARSDAAVLIASRDRRRTAARTVFSAQRTQTMLSVDAEEEPFACYQADDAWVALRCTGEPAIIVLGHGAMPDVARRLVTLKH